MEFYSIRPLTRRPRPSFNSQRDGILPVLGISKAEAKIVSIPNGMEFYGSTTLFGNGKWQFQFPTGWNSTLDDPKKPDDNKTFQFPTGWNSTNIKICLMILSLGFNSQRDGILLKLEIQKGLTFSEFQFPTGWNSTRYCRAALAPFACVSIPNGMEFYQTHRALDIKSLESFNSQRDGILL